MAETDAPLSTQPDPETHDFADLRADLADKQFLLTSVDIYVS